MSDSRFGAVAVSLRDDILRYLTRIGWQTDPAHDLGHLRRVWRNAMLIAEKEGGCRRVLTAAACLHDLVCVAKSSSDRPRASLLSAEAAMDVLIALPADPMFDDAERQAVHHAIVAHSWSAQIEPRTVEARILQDADRLDALGAVGIARCFTVGGSMGRRIAHDEDPLADHRDLDDHAFTLDHFALKLERLPYEMQTATGRLIAQQRFTVVKTFTYCLAAEMAGTA